MKVNILIMICSYKHIICCCCRNPSMMHIFVKIKKIKCFIFIYFNSLINNFYPGTTFGYLGRSFMFSTRKFILVTKWLSLANLPRRSYLFCFHFVWIYLFSVSLSGVVLSPYVWLSSRNQEEPRLLVYSINSLNLFSCRIITLTDYTNFNLLSPNNRFTT